MGSVLSILNFGASLFSFKIKNNKGELIEVVVGPADPEVYTTAQYREENKCFGGSIGRFAGRISEGQFSIGEEKYSVYEEYEGAHLHGGKRASSIVSGISIRFRKEKIHRPCFLITANTWRKVTREI